MEVEIRLILPPCGFVLVLHLSWFLLCAELRLDTFPLHLLLPRADARTFCPVCDSTVPPAAVIQSPAANKDLLDAWLKDYRRLNWESSSSARHQIYLRSNMASFDPGDHLEQVRVIFLASAAGNKPFNNLLPMFVHVSVCCCCSIGIYSQPSTQLDLFVYFWEDPECWFRLFCFSLWAKI